MEFRQGRNRVFPPALSLSTFQDEAIPILRPSLPYRKSAAGAAGTGAPSSQSAKCAPPRLEYPIRRKCGNESIDVAKSAIACVLAESGRPENRRPYPRKRRRVSTAKTSHRSYFMASFRGLNPTAVSKDGSQSMATIESAASVFAVSDDLLSVNAVNVFLSRRRLV